jgi:adenylate cyclase
MYGLVFRNSELKFLMEIERKFLLARLPEPFPIGKRIEQGYLAIPLSGNDSTRVEVRIRRIDEVKSYLTLKQGRGLRRVEFEWNIDDSEFEALWALADGQRLIKRRSRVSLVDGPVAEIDLYEAHLSGFRTVEVEFGSEQAAHHFVPPDWFGKEITDEGEFKNSALARLIPDQAAAFIAQY